MVETGKIHLLKHLPNGQKIEFCGSLEEFHLNCPNSLKTINVDDLCVIKVSEGITPTQVVTNLKFVGTDSSDFSDVALDEYSDFGWDEYQLLPGVIQRQAILIEVESDAIFQIVGIEYGSKVELFARKPPYLCSFLRESYGEENIILESSWYSEGPGPVSWEGTDAIFMIRDFLLCTSQGDGESDDYLVKAATELDLAKGIFDWLVDHGQLVSFILSDTTPNWSDGDLLKTFQVTTKKLLRDSSMVLNLSVDQIQTLRDVIRASRYADSLVLEILESENHVLAQALTQYLVALSAQEPALSLISRGDFLSNILKN